MLAKYIHEANADYHRVRRRVPIGPLQTENDFNRAVAVLDDILDEIGEEETHPLADLAETIALAIESYEDRHVQIPRTSGPVLLQALMEEHRLTQSELPEIGSQGVVSEILSGKRDLNVRQITQLAARFGVSPAAFIHSPKKRTKRRHPKVRKSRIR